MIDGRIDGGVDRGIVGKIDAVIRSKCSVRHGGGRRK
jgi:hypothetical protein